MNRTSHWPATFAPALHAALMRRIPAKSDAVELEQLSRELVEALERGELDLPLNPERWAAACDSGWLEGESAPLLLQGERIGWRRWLEAMDAVVQALLERSSASTKLDTPVDSVALTLPDSLNNEQRAAVLALDVSPVVLLSGGPGTGKTSTVVEMLRRAAARHPDLRIGLAAPTGKAARRLGDTVRPQLEGISCLTLHRWLEAGRDGFRRNRQRPLELDLLVIDEMSMVDLVLMQGLLDAMPPDCRLVMVGDPAQLPPVGSGAVWHRLQQSSIRECFGDGAIHLQRTYRNRGALAELAMVLRDRGQEDFRRCLEDLPSDANVQHHRCSGRRLPKLVRDRWKQRHQRLAALADGLDACSEDALAAAAAPLLAELERELVLCPRRRGSWSLEDVHRNLLGAAARLDPMLWPAGVPVICGGNQPELGLANGDLGVKIGEGERGRLLFRVLSENGRPQIQRLHPARLVVLEPAAALTIHRAQGSEADAVMVLWPQQQDDQHDSQSYDVSLLYTAMTRARVSLELITAEPA